MVTRICVPMRQIIGGISYMSKVWIGSRNSYRGKSRWSFTLGNGQRSPQTLAFATNSPWRSRWSRHDKWSRRRCGNQMSIACLSLLGRWKLRVSLHLTLIWRLIDEVHLYQTWDGARLMSCRKPYVRVLMTAHGEVRRYNNWWAGSSTTVRPCQIPRSSFPVATQWDSSKPSRFSPDC